LQGGNQGKARRVQLSNFDVEYQAVAKSLQLVRAYFFKRLVKEQKLMESENGLAKVLAMLEDTTLIEKVQSSIGLISGSEARWDKLTEQVSFLTSF
jgi:hypothetical protein